MSKSPDVQSVLDWLMDGAKSVHAPQDVLLELCQRLTACGLPIYRATVFVTTLHPNVAGAGFSGAKAGPRSRLAKPATK